MLITGLYPSSAPPALRAPIRAVCFDWGGTLMVDDGPTGVPMSRWPEVVAVPGARECLAALHGRVPLCIATNAAQSDRGMIESALARVDLMPFISRVFCFRELGFGKDRPEFWHAVAEGLDVTPAEIVMIGDSIEQDVRSPRREGLQTVWFDTRVDDPEGNSARPAVTGLGEFAEMLDELIEDFPSIDRFEREEKT